MNKAYAVVLTKDCDSCNFGSMMICDSFHKKEDALIYMAERATESEFPDEFFKRHQILEIGIH